MGSLYIAWLVISFMLGFYCSALKNRYGVSYILSIPVLFIITGTGGHLTYGHSVFELPAMIAGWFTGVFI